MVALPWITDLVSVVPTAPELVGFATTGGPPVGDEREQIVISPIGHWELEGKFHIVRGSDQMKQWLALMARLRGRGGTVLFPVFACLFKSTRAHVPYSDGTTFRDTTVFAQSAVVARLKGGHALNAVDIRITVYAGEISAGDWFSIGGELYQLAEVYKRGSWYDCAISPWFRAAHADGTDLEFKNPVCECRLVDPSQMVLRFEDTRIATPTVRFREA